MSDKLLETPSFGIVDTIATSSQELVDAFLDDSTAVTTPEEIQDINSKPEEVAKKQVAKKAEPEKKEEVKEEEKPFDLNDILEGDAPEEDTPAQKTEESSKDEEETDEQFNAFESFAKELFNLGVFESEEEGEVKLPASGEEFLQTFNENVGKKAEGMLSNYLARFGDDYQDAFDAIFVKGLHPREYYQTVREIDNYANLDLSIEANQEAVVRETFRNMEYEEADIDTEIVKLKDYGDLEDFAKKSHKGLVKKEASKLEEKLQQQQKIREQQAAVKKQFATKVSSTLQDKLKTKEFDGIPLNPRLVQEVQDMLITEKWKNAAGEPLTDFDVEILNLKKPENHEMKVKYALLLKLLKDDPTLSTIQKSGVTKQTNKLFSDVVRNKPKTATVTTKSGNSHWNSL